MLLVREAVEADLAEILAIYNHAIATTNAVYTETPSTLEERRLWLSARRDGGFPVLVAHDGEVLGFASFGPFRPWPGYARTIEHSVYVERAARQRGIGTALMRCLIAEASERGKHMMIGGVDGGNAPSIALHRKFGFTEAGVLKNIACKFGRPLDLVLFQKSIRQA